MSNFGSGSAFGGGGGGAASSISPFWTTPLTPPVSSAFTLVQGTSVTASLADKSRGVLASILATSGADRNALMENNVPGATWTMTALIIPNFVKRQYTSIGPYVKDSATGRIAAFNFADDALPSTTVPVPLFRESRWTTINSFSANGSQFSCDYGGGPLWVRLVLGATNLDFYHSMDGETFSLIYSVAKNAYVANIDKCGLMLTGGGAVGQGTFGGNDTSLIMSYSLA